MSDQRNLILAILLSVGIILAFQFLYEMPRVREAQQRAPQQQSQPTARETAPAAPSTAPGVPAPTATPGQPSPPSREAVLEELPRLPIDNGSLHGSVALQGGRIDDVRLAHFFETLARKREITILSPPGAQDPYFVEFGWTADTGNQGLALPGRDTPWQVVGGGAELGADAPVRLAWDNGAGLRFEKTVALDEHYMFTLGRTVTNTGDEPVTLFPYGLISRWGTPQTLGFYILHEGPLGVFDDKLREIDYSDLAEDGDVAIDSMGGWLGIGDKYWLTALVPSQDEAIKANFRHTLVEGQDRYQVDYIREGVTVAPGQTIEVQDRVFVGAKEVERLDAYAEEYGIPLFDRAIDFGWFYFLTKPIALFLHWLYGVVGNYGVAILILTLLVKLAFFPLANKSYTAMSKMKALQPEMLKLRERFENDKAKLQQEMMALYKREKVNPMAGCLPIIIQIPVFFALYKVLFVSIEMRHAPFFGWIQDLSAPDPTSIFNLFGLLPFDPPQFLMIGVWPVLMGLTMLLQMKLNPAPPDPIQARIMTMLPLVFTFLFATFPAGLVIYWTWNNILSIAQQWLIMRRMGVKPG